MKRGFNLNTTNEQEWLTPPEIIRVLGDFDLDPCAPPPERRPWSTAKLHYSKEEHGDGLALPWEGRVWLNPPYGKEVFKWLNKLSKHKSGIALIFARTDTIGFHAEIWNKAHSIFFLKGRLSFYKKGGHKANVANAPSCLVSYSQEDTQEIQIVSELELLRGRLVFL